MMWGHSGIRERDKERIDHTLREANPLVKQDTENMRVLKTPDGEDVVVSINSDVCLYKVPMNPPFTERGYTAGNDIYAHKAQSGAIYYYTHSWSLKQPAGYSLLTADEVRNRLINLAGLSGWSRLNSDEMKTAERYFPGIFDEAA